MPEEKLPNDKIICVVGPTSSGKSELAVKLAKRFNGEIISCDSRQIYKGMNIGTGKVTGIWKSLPNIRLSERSEGSQKKYFIYKNIPHHLIDFVSPKKIYSSGLFQQQAQKIIADILKRERLPILCGGSGHWIDSVVFGQQFPEVKPNFVLRKKLEKFSTEKLFQKLLKLDARRAANIDKHNRRRLIRALEIINFTGKPIPKLEQKALFDALWLGINLPQNELFTKIQKRLKQRLKQGMLHEVKILHKQGLSYKKLTNFGLEYKYSALFLQKKISTNEMFSQLLLAIQHYSKRQQTWFKRNKNIHWIRNQKQAEKLSTGFLK